jgi:succinate dehydrogenase/fumarate reductase iron-sulfur protein
MARKTAIFRILRYKPGHIDPPVYQDFKVHLTPAMSVLDALESIRLTQDAGLMYRHCCHHASCGTCACSIDGVPALACTTRIEVPASGIITLEPLAQHRCVGDLAVDTAAFLQGLRPPVGRHSEMRRDPGFAPARRGGSPYTTGKLH